nr:putative disease resistance protein RGA3 [Ipomoea batatas]
MADALISIVVDQLFNILKDQVEELRAAMGVEKEITSLSSKLKKMREVLDDAEKRSFKENGVKLWVDTIQDFSYEVDNVLDEWRTRILTQQIERSEVAAPVIRRKTLGCSSFLPSCFHFKKLVVHRDIALKIKELDSRLDQIVKEKEQFNFLSVTHTSDQESKRVTTTSFGVDTSEIQGRDIDASDLIRELVKKDDGEEAIIRNGPPVISIVGTGGIGKTTLAQLVFGDEQIKAHFDERVWICVSHPFDEIKVAKAFVESMTKSSTNLSQLQVLLERIQTSLSNKRFLIVLDDVWTEQSAKWEPFKNSLKVGLPGSRILLTSRSERVARVMGTVYMHRLDQISDSDAWLLLSRIAFSGRREEDCEKLKDIGQKIAQKCKGLPLAVKAMGSLLCFKNTEEEWQNVFDSKIWELEEVTTDLFPHLYLSYDDLTPKMKRCLSYCSIFPKDYDIQVDKLIRIWMAQGYLTTTNGSDHNQMELKGRELFGDLAMRSFFQDLEKDDMDSNTIISCKMHDIVHDFTEFLTRNECHSIDQHEDKVKIENLRHLSWQKSGRLVNPASVCDIGKLRSFFAEYLSPKELTPNLFNGLKSVRVLGLHGCELHELPKEIKNLLHLRYIDLSYSQVEELPDAICSLYNLQTLDLEGCRRLSRLPERIDKLINLRHLNIRDTPRLEILPQGIAKLTQLCSLSDFVVGKESSKLGYMEKLNQLQGNLSIHVIGDLNNAADVEEAENADLKNKKHLKELRFNFFWESEVRVDVMEALKPPPKLQSLTIDGYRGIQLPSWITLSLDNLRVLEINECFNCSCLPPLGKLPCLETLCVRLMDELKYVGSEFLGVAEVGGVAFPKLKKLHFSYCSEWKEWQELKKEAVIQSKIMPCLRELEVDCCRKLKTVPHHLVSRTPPLECLKIKGCPSLKLDYSDMSHIPHATLHHM